ncbi:hypothetical protein FISHEDRAFT_77673 [Fistulina hepatica ATCC 64428]|uniref:Uncharacterized protein n=1 Tax=Fistulina hepatica ATCC 64428 TaxID=1128425 RepID=A0A0D7A109_9AGAR|nr:hypothetical protein FISHEDRAFT_77673 [Fistulina hepatica ATCC 64428]
MTGSGSSLFPPLVHIERLPYETASFVVPLATFPPAGDPACPFGSPTRGPAPHRSASPERLRARVCSRKIDRGIPHHPRADSDTGQMTTANWSLFFFLVPQQRRAASSDPSSTASCSPLYGRAATVGWRGAHVEASAWTVRLPAPACPGHDPITYPISNDISLVSCDLVSPASLSRQTEHKHMLHLTDFRGPTPADMLPRSDSDDYNYRVRH